MEPTPSGPPRKVLQNTRDLRRTSAPRGPVTGAGTPLPSVMLFRRRTSSPTPCGRRREPRSESVQQAAAASVGAFRYAHDPRRPCPAGLPAVGHACGDRPARLRAARLADADRSAASSRRVVDAIGMRAHGPLHLERFGDGELEGWSAMQFIETSSITLHADEFGGRCFVDVFSCRPFDADVAAAIAAAHFGGTPTVRVLRAMTDARPRVRRARRRWSASRTRSPTSATSCAAATRPHRGTWLIWGVLAIVVCLSQRADGASWSLVMAGAQAVLNRARSSCSRSGCGDGRRERVDGAHDRDRRRRGGGLAARGRADRRDRLRRRRRPDRRRDDGPEDLPRPGLGDARRRSCSRASAARWQRGRRRGRRSLLLYPIYYCLVNGAIALLIHHRRAVLAGAPALAAGRA